MTDALLTQLEAHVYSTPPASAALHSAALEAAITLDSPATVNRAAVDVAYGPAVVNMAVALYLEVLRSVAVRPPSRPPVQAVNKFMVAA